MSLPTPQPTTSNRHRAWARVRAVTHGALLAATGMTAVIGIVLVKEHAGSSSTAAPSASGGGAGSSSSGTATTGTTGNTGSSGNSGSGTGAPSATFSTPTVTSGGSSHP